MTMMGMPPFALPDAPIDGYRVTWFEVGSDNLSACVSERHAIYHVHTRWADYAPGARGGADIINQWMCGDGERTTGRTNEGWREAFKDYDWRRCFATRGEAVAEALRMLRRHLHSLDEQRARLEQRIAELGGNR